MTVSFQSYLPYRQLRNETVFTPEVIGGYLPYRQLRKHGRQLRLHPNRYLPYRQLRNPRKYNQTAAKRYLPYRQVIYFIVLFLWLTSDGGRLFVLRG